MLDRVRITPIEHILSMNKLKLIVYVFLAYLPTVLDDAPLNFDSSVANRIGSYIAPTLQLWIEVDLIFHLISLAFFILAIREAMKR